MVLGEGSRSGNDAVLRIAREQDENGANKSEQRLEGSEEEEEWSELTVQALVVAAKASLLQTRRGTGIEDPGQGG